MSTVSAKSVETHFDLIAKDYDQWKKKNSYYYDAIKAFVKGAVCPGSKVLEVGCATGEILASAKPSIGVGIDISSKMIEFARKKFPQYTFIYSAIENFQYQEKFDYIIMADLLDHVYDIQDIFESLYKFCHPTTRIIMTTINPWWEPVLLFMEKIKAKMPEGEHNFIEIRNLTKIIEFLDFSICYSCYLLLAPKHIPLVSFLANTIGVRIWGMNKLSLVQYMLLHPFPRNRNDLGFGCSVIIPCYNEAENIQEAVRRIPKMGKETEIIVVNDGSKDETANIVRKLKNDYSNLKLIEYSPNRGKGFAVKQGFNLATQEILIILDADMSVAPEELPRFFNLLNEGRCDFVNGTRMIYSMPKQAMRFLHLFGNKVFSLVMSFIIEQSLTDTLCGTKALYKKDYQRMMTGLDIWGDFDLLFGAAKLGNKIMEIPVHYRERKTGESKMKTIRHGFQLLRACFRGFKELTFSR